MPRWSGVWTGPQRSTKILWLVTTQLFSCSITIYTKPLHRCTYWIWNWQGNQLCMWSRIPVFHTKRTIMHTQNEKQCWGKIQTKVFGINNKNINYRGVYKSVKQRNSGRTPLPTLLQLHSKEICSDCFPLQTTCLVVSFAAIIRIVTQRFSPPELHVNWHVWYITVTSSNFIHVWLLLKLFKVTFKISIMEEKRAY